MTQYKTAETSEKAQALFAAFDRHVASATATANSPAPKPIALARNKE